MPSHSWCKVCLRAKAGGAYHKQHYDRQHLLQADYGFLTDKVTKQLSRRHRNDPASTSLPGWAAPASCFKRVSATTLQPPTLCARMRQIAWGTTDRSGSIHHPRTRPWTSTLHKTTCPTKASVLARIAGKHRALPMAMTPRPTMSSRSG